MAAKPPFDGFDASRIFGDSLKAFETFKLPGFDIAKLMEINRKDFEALSAAHRATLESLKAAPAAYQEQLRAAYTQLGELSQQLLRADAGTGAAGRVQAAQEAIAQALGNFRELAETANKSQTEAYGLLLKRAHQRIQELTALFAAGR